MSIATLKKKTQAQYNNMSVGSTTGFSLNGVHRNQGYVGQTSLSRSLPRTLMHGNVPRGHGGCCGKFPLVPVVQSAVQSLENQHAPGTPLPNTIKSSVINTQGMIAEKYRWVNRPYPYSSVKPDNNQHLYASSDHTRIVKKNTLTEVNAIDNKTTPNALRCFKNTPNCMRYNSFYRTKTCNFTKPESDYIPISSGEYIEQLDKKCAVIDETTIQTNVRPGCGAPMACGISM
jgi:hypothetical protein